MERDNRPYKIVGAYDSETTNYVSGDDVFAFPILHQLGILDCDIEHINPSNIESCCSVRLFRESLDLFAALDAICEWDTDFVPVVCCHNLAFDMYGLSGWLNQRNESGNVRVLAKSKQKPITFTIQDENGKNLLVIWDTLVFSQQTLDGMGRDCGYLKASGKWDYNLIRTTRTPLTDDEIEYSKADIYSLLCWLSWWISRNPDIDPSKLALNVVTKTGVVRERKKVRFDSLRGIGRSYDVGRSWYYHNRNELAKTDEELFTMTACTRGGFTFCASKHASIPYDLVDSGYVIAGYDATSQHPAQMVSHLYPVGFREASTKALDTFFEVIQATDIEYMLNRWHKPFGFAFNALFHIEGLRPKAGSIWERNGIAPFSSARLYRPVMQSDSENEAAYNYADFAYCCGYADTAEREVCEFGKLVRAESCDLFLTELAAWELCQCYDFDSIQAVGGFVSTRFVRPTDMAVLSVMQFYKAKNAFKSAREHFYATRTIENERELLDLHVPESIVNSMKDGSISDSEVDSAYQRLKTDLNALFGIEACNEFRCDTLMTASGIEYDEVQGIANSPENPKAWYQFGQRIVGWSRIAQIVNASLADDFVLGIVNGDTDSLKFIVSMDLLNDLSNSLLRFGKALDEAKRIVCKRVKESFPDLFDSLDYIGYYVHEFSTARFCASWNKAYCLHDFDKRTKKRSFAFTIAGIPARQGANEFADLLYEAGYSFSEICDLMLGYNVTYSYDVTGLNARSFPKWGDVFQGIVKDYLGNSCRICEPAALALYPMSKTLNDTRNAQNRGNLAIAEDNNPYLSSIPSILYWHEDGRPGILRNGEVIL